MVFEGGSSQQDHSEDLWSVELRSGRRLSVKEQVRSKADATLRQSANGKHPSPMRAPVQVLNSGNLGLISGKIEQISATSNETRRLMNGPAKLCHGKKQRSRFWVASAFEDYCKQSTMHGLHFLYDRSRPLLERLFWLAVVVLSAGVCLNLIVDQYNQLSLHPYILTLDLDPTPIWALPFPSVRVCSNIPVKKSSFDLSVNDSRKFQFFASTVCPQMRSTTAKQGMNQTMNESEFMDFLYDVSVTCEELFHKCIWRGERYDCCDRFFEPVVTESGICYVFNAMPADMMHASTSTTGIQARYLRESSENYSYWNPDSLYEPSPEPPPHPKRAFRAGERNGLVIQMKSNDYEAQEECTDDTPGFKFSVSSPLEQPQDSSLVLNVAVGIRLQLQASQVRISTEAALRPVSYEQRGCYFHGERMLKYYRYYTQNNCMEECLALSLVRRCGCIMHYLPRSPDIPLCATSEEMTCYLEEEGDVQEKAGLPFQESRVKNGTEVCGCLPACSELSFSLETFYNLHDLEESNLTSINLYFKSNHYYGIHRQKHTSFGGFLGTCGGLLGCFLGLSFISLVELLYFFLVRPLYGTSERLESWRKNGNGTIARFLRKVKAQPILPTSDVNKHRAPFLE